MRIVALAIKKWQKRQRRQPSYYGAQHQLQLIFNVSSITGRSSSLQSGYRHLKRGSQAVDFSTRRLIDGFFQLADRWFRSFKRR
tara:strand:- start:107 stop:358 length:252 start_codon:yes stop_codon:yes gene_type:complete